MNYFSLLDELKEARLVRIWNNPRWAIELHHKDEMEAGFYCCGDSLQQIIREAYNYAFPIPKNTYCQYCALKDCTGECV